ncbi:uncharacterized protein LOC143636432 [Bidens hawaiensis]|uniref:uncharacterized protein LOC143636432 n=1 Tax=Bidens hawaiensis TaxID=980011 RepID=UPI004048F6B8
MASSKITLFKDLNNQMSDFILKGRVIRLWRQPANKRPSETYSIELILLDTQGSKIQVTVLNQYVSKFKRYLQERLCLQISNAKLGSNKGNQKFCDNPHKVSFFDDTKVTICEDFGGSIHGLNLVSFEDIEHYKLPTDISLDIIAYVSTCSEIKELKLKNGKDSKHCVATINDLEGNNLQLTLWDEYADQLTTYKRKNPTVEPVVVILQFAKYKKWDAGPSVSNMYYGSKLYINTELPEIEEFRNRLL